MTPAVWCRKELGHIRAEHEARFMDQYGRSPACRGVAEVEAESIAFLVAASAGLDASDYTVPYVAGWAGGDVGLLKDTASRVLMVSRGILDDAGLGVGDQRALTIPACGAGPRAQAAVIEASAGRAVNL